MQRCTILRILRFHCQFTKSFSNQPLTGLPYASAALASSLFQQITWNHACIPTVTNAIPGRYLLSFLLLQSCIPGHRQHAESTPRQIFRCPRHYALPFPCSHGTLSQNAYNMYDLCKITHYYFMHFILQYIFFIVNYLNTLFANS